MNLTVQGKFEIYSMRGGYRIICYRRVLAKRLQRFLQSYPADAVFYLGDEPQFNCTRDQLGTVLRLLGVKGAGHLLSVENKGEN